LSTGQIPCQFSSAGRDFVFDLLDGEAVKRLVLPPTAKPWGGKKEKDRRSRQKKRKTDAPKAQPYAPVTGNLAAPTLLCVTD